MGVAGVAENRSANVLHARSLHRASVTGVLAMDNFAPECVCSLRAGIQMARRREIDSHTRAWGCRAPDDDDDDDLGTSARGHTTPLLLPLCHQTGDCLDRAVDRHCYPSRTFYTDRSPLQGDGGGESTTSSVARGACAL